MRDHPEDGLPNQSSSNASEKNTGSDKGMQRRDLLLGGSSLAAMTALAAASPASAQDQPPPRPPEVHSTGIDGGSCIDRSEAR